jgi:hypothetical protein
MAVYHDVIGIVDAHTGVLEQVGSADLDGVPELAPSPMVSAKPSG